MPPPPVVLAPQLFDPNAPAPMIILDDKLKEALAAVRAAREAEAAGEDGAEPAERDGETV